MPVRHYRDLVAWQKAMEMVVEVYRLTRLFPKEEQYGLTNQLRRAAVSIPSTIAEGQGRGIGQSFRQFLRTAKGSLQEVETQIILAEKLEFISASQRLAFLDRSCEVARLLAGLLKSVDD